MLVLTAKFEAGGTAPFALPRGLEQVARSRHAELLPSGAATLFDGQQTVIPRKLAESLGARRCGRGFTLDARMVPTALDRRTVAFAQASDSVATRDLPLAFDGRTVAFAGPAWSIIGTANHSAWVVAPEHDDVDLASQVVARLDRLAAVDRDLVGGDGDKAPDYWVVRRRGQFGDEEAAPHVFSNLLIGPFADASSTVGFSLAARAVLDRLVAGGASASAPATLACTAAAADLLQHALFGGAMVFAGPLAEERMRHRLARVGDLEAFLACQEVTGVIEQERVIELLAPHVLARLRASLAAEIQWDPEAVAREVSRWVADRAAANDVRLWADPAASVAAAIDAIRMRSTVVPAPQVAGDARSDAASPIAPTWTVELANDHGGYLESCGCKASQGGGFIDLYTRWAVPPAADEIRLLLGEVLGVPTRSGYRREANELLLQSATELAVAAWVPGVRELESLAAGDLAGSDIAVAQFVACNVVVRVGRMQLRPFTEVVGNAGRCRIIGVTRERARHAGRATAELIDAMFEIRDPVDAVVAQIAAAPLDAALIVAGAIDPAEAARIAAAAGRPVLFCSSDGLLPRIAEDRIVRDQVDGAVGGQPIAFAPLGAYFVKRVEWRPGIRVSVAEVDLRGSAHDAPARARFRERARKVLEQDDGPVELRFVEPRAVAGNAYVGSAKCVTCHAAEHADWSASPHATAWKTLERAQRQGVRNCVACHVVGFDQPSGYEFERPDPALRDVGCEVCHGPGGQHVAKGGDQDAIVGEPGLERCAACHTSEHSDMFLLDPADFLARVGHHSSLEGN